MPELKEQLKVKRLTESAFLPTRGSKEAAGYDLYASAPFTLPARGRLLVIRTKFLFP